MRRSTYKLSLLGAIALSAIATGATAQNTSNEVDEVVVTGSLIRQELSSQLVTTVSREEIAQRAATNAVEILNTISQNNSVDVSSQTATFGGLVNLANLRSLGSENTLVLLNGRRMVKNPLRDNGVDLNTVPTALVESVDVLSDGASSIYGTDAVAGVINFRTRESVQGLQYYLNTMQPEQPGGESYAASLSGGIGSLANDGWNLFVGGSYRKKNAISSRTRDYAKTGVLPERGVDGLLVQGFPANFSQTAANGTVIINNANPYPNCFPPATVPYRGGCGLDADAAGFIDLQNPEEQQSAIAKFTRKLGDHTLSLEYLGGWSSITSGLTPTTFSGFTVPTTSPFFPGRGTVPSVPGLDPNRPISINTRFTPAGQRITESQSYTDRLLLELDGEVGGTRYNVWALRSTGLAKLKSVQGAVLTAALRAGFAGTGGAPFINPFGAQAPEAAAYLESIQVRQTLVKGWGDLQMAGLTLQRDVFDLPAGTVKAAVAVEYGHEEVKYSRAPINALLTGAVVGGDAASRGERDRYSVTGEVIVPVTETLELNGSARYDHYNDFGSTFNPKIQAKWEVTDNLNVHGSYAKGFRAPTLYNLYTPNTLSTVQALRFNDPVLCPNGVVNAAQGGVNIRDCNQLYNTLLGGNKDLDPEKSESWTVGLDFTVPETILSAGTLRVSLDYWNYRLDNRIAPLSVAAIFADPTRFSDLLVRCNAADPALKPNATTCNFAAGGNPIAYVVQGNTNTGVTKTSGVDLGANFVTETGFGTVIADYRGTYVDEYKFERVPGQGFFSRRGAHFDGFPVLGYSHYATLSLVRGPWVAQLQNRFKGEYDDCNAQCGLAPAFFNEVGSYTLWNLAVSYKVSERLNITAHLNNVFDTDPPFSFNTTLCSGCDLRLADVNGRTFGITLRGSFEGFSDLWAW